MQKTLRDVSTSLDMTNGIRILVAPDKFKGSLSSREAAENIAKGLRDVCRDAIIDIVPMADGGDGTAEAICDALGGSWLKCNTHDPLGREIGVRYAWIEKRRLAVMEMSETAGMRRVSERERYPLRANTFGVGEMLLDAACHDAREIIIGLGGSATNDGGSGMARALGFRFFEHEKEHELGGVFSDLVRLGRIEKPKDLALPKIIAAVDVRNPLLGGNGATRVFGSQKGASKNDLDVLEQVLTKLADVIANEFGFDYRDKPGAGAAGGLGFGLMSFCGAKIRPGFDVVAKAVGLEAKIKDADVVITGEGSLDRQTLEGKTPAGVARLARRLGKRVIAIAGRTDGNQEAQRLFDQVYQLAQAGISNEEQIARAAELLREKALHVAKEL
jgi:glycerate 2-kinase